MSTEYFVRESQPKTYEITVFEDGRKEEKCTYIVKKPGRYYSCNCPGYWRQKHKSEHKHCRIVKFWIEELNKQYNYVFWIDELDNICYNRIYNLEELRRML